MFLGWVGVALVLEHIEGYDELFARVARLDDLVHVPTGGGDVGVGELLLVVIDQILPPLFGVGSVIYLIFEDDANGTIYAHHGDLGSGPSVIDIAADVLAAHDVVGAAIRFARDDRHLGDGRLAVGVQKLGAMANDAPMLLSDARQEARHVLQRHNGDFEAVEEADEARSFIGGVDVEDTSQYGRLLGDNANGAAIETSQADDDILCPLLLDFEEGATVNDGADDLPHVVGLV